MRIFCLNSEHAIYIPKPNDVIKCFIIQNTRLVVAPLDDLNTSTQLCQKSVLSNSPAATLYRKTQRVMTMAEVFLNDLQNHQKYKPTQIRTGNELAV